MRLKQFTKKQLRWDLYSRFLKLIDKGFETEAMILMLSTWNFARFRYAIRSFNVDQFEKTLDNLKPLFRKIQKENFKTINFDSYSKDIKRIFNALAKIKGIEKTGAPKLMHLKAPKVFVMWDTKIRKYYGFNTGDAGEYIEFLKLMQKKFRSQKSLPDRSLAKLIDENNYNRITLPALEKSRPPKI